MTQDEIIEMARQAGLWPAVTDTFKKELEAFAKLVAAKEREACAKVCDEWANGPSSEPEMEKMAAEIRARGEE
jgi:hypothetical protein